MRAFRKREQFGHRSFSCGVVVLLLMATDGSSAQDAESIGQSFNATPSSATRLRLPGTDERADDLPAGSNGDRPIRNELRLTQEPSPERRAATGPPEAVTSTRDLNQAGGAAQSSLSSQADIGVGTQHVGTQHVGTRQAMLQSGAEDRPDGSQQSLATAHGSINRTASVAPPQPLHTGSTSPNPLAHDQGGLEEVKSGAPTVHVIGEGPNPFEDLGRQEPSSDLRSSPSKSLRLAPPQEKKSATTSSFAASWAKPQVMTTVLSLAVVLASFFALTWFVRRSKPAASAKLPEEAVEILGRLPLEGRQQIQLVRFGRKLLLWVVTPNSVQTLSEITDPEDVDQLMEFCEASKRGSLSESFRQVLNELGNEPTNRGFLADRSLEEILAASDQRRGRNRRGAYEA